MISLPAFGPLSAEGRIIYAPLISSNVGLEQTNPASNIEATGPLTDKKLQLLVVELPAGLGSRLLGVLEDKVIDLVGTEF